MRKSLARRLIDEYMEIAQPERGSTNPHPCSLTRIDNTHLMPDTTRTAYYWMAMGIAQLLQEQKKKS
ncbi:MAG TPA: hypothetical protein VJK48_00735 [Chlamydiales bacterium]|nr:hypothetical protein [Chlamydiales bacterium]